jgi:hypothetical protein
MKTISLLRLLCLFAAIRGAISWFAAGQSARFVLHYGASVLRKCLMINTLHLPAFFRAFPLTRLPLLLKCRK